MILSLVVGVAIEAIRGARVVTARVSAHHDASSHTYAALGSLRRDLAAAFDAGPDSFVGLPAGAGAPFPGVIACVTLGLPDLLERPGAGDVRQVEYRVEPRDGADGPFALVRRVIPLAPGATVPVVRSVPERLDGPPFEPVALKLASLTARFSDGKRLRDRWDRDRGLPAAVEIVVAVRGPDAQPPLTARTLIALPAGARVEAGR